MVTFEREVLSIEISVKFSHGPNNGQCLSFTDGIILFPWDSFLLAYRMGCLTPSHSCRKQAPKLKLYASVCKINSRFKSGSFKIGSLERIRLISLNAWSCLFPHLTSFGARPFVSSVIAVSYTHLTLPTNREV